jgi:hypothetical protein
MTTHMMIGGSAPGRFAGAASGVYRSLKARPQRSILCPALLS